METTQKNNRTRFMSGAFLLPERVFVPVGSPPKGLILARGVLIFRKGGEYEQTKF